MTGGMGGRRNPGAPQDLAVDMTHGTGQHRGVGNRQDLWMKIF